MKLTIIFISTLITYAAALDCMGCVQMFNDCRKQCGDPLSWQCTDSCNCKVSQNDFCKSACGWNKC
ncbi:hypothetical protein BU26DRAFT_604509 [Trematosphaeria pertusa]|uniref:Uncharacterized protein n=1 Tax=Trematosphaeria pertusa TaxID=390896 RepID=A0A6A6ILA0_9PLEO|nr:uncharacterized protein BU26DRAFT_604509 [Trematosphaeria pertusa]KAF2250320.1 hypothetical protein BU26DRAFT_604509 [Trematosphaeria pertusa]